MFHIELRQFPHTANRFNLDQAALWAVLEPWVQERVVELGERRWSPQQATLTVLEGPEIPLQRLSMGRGWGTAERSSEDVTEHVLAQARAAVAERAAGPGAQPAPANERVTAPVAGGLAAGVELAGLLGADAARLLAAWGAVAAGAPGLTPSESLALAERRLAETDRPPGSGREGDG